MERCSGVPPSRPRGCGDICLDDDRPLALLVRGIPEIDETAAEFCLWRANRLEDFLRFYLSIFFEVSEAIYERHVVGVVFLDVAKSFDKGYFFLRGP